MIDLSDCCFLKICFLEAWVAAREGFRAAFLLLLSQKLHWFISLDLFSEFYCLFSFANDEELDEEEWPSRSKSVASGEAQLSD